MASPFVVGSHHLARGMAALGHEVIHVSPPVTLAHVASVKNEFQRARWTRWWRGGETACGVVDIVPFALFTWGVCRLTRRPVQAYGLQLLPSLLKLLAKHRARSVDVVFIDEPRLGFVLEFISMKSAVYRPTDLYAKLRHDDSIISAERFVIPKCQAYIATSEPVATHLRSLGATCVHIIENGVDLEAFARERDVDVEDELPPRPRAVYAGAFDRRFDFEALRLSAAALTHVSFVLVGPIDQSERRKLKDLPNVFIVGPVGRERLPSILRRCQLGLLPLSDDAANQGRSPMKIYEYAAAGLQVVSTRTPELSRRQLSFVRFADTADEFSRAVQDFFERSISTADAVDVSAYSWAAKCEQVLKIAIDSRLRFLQ